MSKLFGISSVSVLALAWATPGHGQTADAAPTASSATSPQPAPLAPVQATAVASAQPTDDNGIGDIIVTAERRSESLQKTALSISVVRPESLALAGVTSPAQLTSLLPTIQVGSAGPTTSVYIRGVGGFQSTASTSPAVPYYVDGVYVARTPSLLSEFYDVERLEVLKGPQGTLYGRNASGGAINVITTRPTFDRIKVRGEFEIGNYGDQTAEAAINLPLSSNLALRASGTVVDKGGYTSLRLGDDVHQAGRVKLLWEPNSDVSLLLNANYGHAGGRTAAVAALNKDIPGWYPWLDVSDVRAQAYAISTAVAPPPFVVPSDGADAKQQLSFYNLSAQLDWKFGQTTLTVIPAYRDSKIRNVGLIGIYLDNGYGVGTLPARPERSKASSLEVRLAGDRGRLHWLLGGFYYNEDQYQQYTVDGGFIQHPGVIADYGTRSFAAFSQNTFSVSDAFRLILGARYTIDKRRVDNGQSYLISPALFPGPPPSMGAPCAFPAPTQPQCLVDSFDGKKTFKNFSWKFGFESDVFDNSLFYATVSRGFKAGGFNAQSEVGTLGVAAVYNPELLTSYDVGLKSRFFNNRVQFNLTGFYWDYKNHQEPVLTYTNVPGVTNLIYQNAGRAEIYGGSVDLIAKLWRGGSINSSVEYAHSRYTDYTITLPSFAYNPLATGCRKDTAKSDLTTTTLDCSGFEVARTPKWSGNVGITQEIPLGSGRLIANGDMTFASSRWLSVDFVPVTRGRSYSKFDASLTYRGAGNHWSVTGFVRNIGNTAVYTTGGLSAFNALAYGYIQPPRTYGGRAGFNF